MTDLSSSIRDYLERIDDFALFETTHLVTIAVTIGLAIGLPLLGLRLPERHRIRLGVFLGGCVAASYLVWIALEVLAGTFDLSRHLPLHLCWVANLALPFAMTGRSLSLFEIVYYWGLAAGIQATVTPIAEADFPHWHYISYVLRHNGMVVTLIYGVVCYDLRPTLLGIGKAFLAANVLLLVAIPVDMALDANYLFLCRKPETPSLLDYMGPWPWYIVAGELIGVLHFALAYAPIAVWNRLSPQSRELGKP